MCTLCTYDEFLVPFFFPINIAQGLQLLPHIILIHNKKHVLLSPIQCNRQQRIWIKFRIHKILHNLWCQSLIHFFFAWITPSPTKIEIYEMKLRKGFVEKKKKKIRIKVGCRHDRKNWRKHFFFTRISIRTVCSIT